MYVGVTSNLAQRVWQHRQNLVDGFSKKHDIHLLVYYELHATMDLAIQREKQLKKWNRQWKIKLIEKDNPHWQDLFEQIC